MKIEDLVQLLNNRLREFQLSRDYARMSGDLERMNVADKEVIALEDTLYKLNLLVDTSKSAAVKEATLAEVITDGSVAVLGEYDITSYATDPLHEEKIMNILSNMGVMDTVEKIEEYIRSKYVSSPVTGEMVMSAALAYSVDARLMMAIMEQDSRFGTAGLAVSTLNPGNVGNTDAGDTVTYDSWQEGVTAVAAWLSRHRGSTTISETPLETVLEPMATSTPPTMTSMATSTPPTMTSMATSTPVITTSTTTTITNLPTTSTTTPVTATSTPTTATSTTTPSVTATSTPAIVTTAPVTVIATEETIPVATSTPMTATSTLTTATSTTTPPVTVTSTEETIPVATSTPATATSTTTTATSTTTPLVIATSTPTTSTSTTTTATTPLVTATGTPN